MLGLVKRSLAYFIVGYLAGFIAWALSLLFAGVAQTNEQLWLIGVMLIFGALIGGTVGTVELTVESPQKLRGFFGNFQWFLIGALFGMMGGLLGAFAGRGVFIALTEQIHSPLFGRTCGTFLLGLILGALVGVVEKLRTDSWERFTSVVIAGALGGAFTGALRHLLVQYVDFVDSFAILLIGFGGVMVSAIAVVTTMRSGAVLLGHADNVSRTPKYGPGFEFLLSSDSRTLIGSGFSDRDSSKTQLKIYDDDLVDSIQAALLFSDDGWYLAPPPGFPEAGEHNYVGAAKVDAPVKLKHGDIVTFGQTKFHFKLQRQQETSETGFGFAALLFCLLSSLFAASPASAQPPPPADWSMECLSNIEITESSPYQYYFRFRTFDPQTRESAPVPIEPFISIESWNIEDERGTSLGDVQWVRPVNQIVPQRGSIHLVVAVDLSLANPDSAQERILENPDIILEFLDKINEISRVNNAEVKVALVLFASDAPTAQNIAFYPSQKSGLKSRFRKELAAYRSSGNNCNCTAIFPAVDRCLAALEREDPERQALRGLFVISDGVHDLWEKAGSYDCEAIGRQFEPHERNPNAVIEHLEQSNTALIFLGTKRLADLGKKLDRLILQERTSERNRLTAIPVPGSFEFSLPRGSETKRLTQTFQKLNEKLGNRSGGETVASEWELSLLAADQSRGASLAFPAAYLNFRGNRAEIPCHYQLSFMAVTTPSDGRDPQRKLIMALVGILILWILLVILFYVGYLMTKRRHQTALEDAEPEAATAAARRPGSPFPRVGGPMGGYVLPKSTPKPPPPPKLQEELEEETDDNTPEQREEKPQKTADAEAFRPEPQRQTQPPPQPPRPEFDDRLVYPDFQDDEPFPDEGRLGH